MSEFDLPQTMKCPDCGKVMDNVMEGTYSNRPLLVVHYAIYHCRNENCMCDYTKEQVWECTQVSERRYFHG